MEEPPLGARPPQRAHRGDPSPEGDTVAVCVLLKILGMTSISGCGVSISECSETWNGQVYPNSLAVSPQTYVASLVATA